jgi:hypothetical protein
VTGPEWDEAIKRLNSLLVYPGGITWIDKDVDVKIEVTPKPKPKQRFPSAPPPQAMVGWPWHRE